MRKVDLFPGRRGINRKKNNRRHLRRMGSSRRRRFFRKGFYQSGQVCRVRGSMGRQKPRQSRPVQEVSGSGVVCHRRRRTPIHHALRLRNLHPFSKTTLRNREKEFRFATGKDSQVSDSTCLGSTRGNETEK